MPTTDTETETTATLTEEKPAVAPAAGESADTTTAEPTTEPEPKPEPTGETEEPSAKSSADTLFDSIMALPEDERDAQFSSIEKRYAEKGEVPPWAKRQEAEQAERTAVASRLADQQQRQAERQGWESQQKAADENMDVVVKRFGDEWAARGLDDPAPTFDAKTFREERDSYVSTAAALLSQKSISDIGQAMNEGLAEHGGPLSQAEIAAVTSAGGVGDKVRVYLAHLAARMKLEVADEMEAGIDTRIKQAVATEIGAKTVQENRGAKVEPDKPKGAAVDGRDEDEILLDPTTHIDTIREISARRAKARA